MEKQKSWFRKNLDLILFGIGAAGFATAMYCGLFDTKPVTIYKSGPNPKTIEAKVIEYQKPEPKIILNIEEQCDDNLNFNCGCFPPPFVVNGIPSPNYAVTVDDNLAYSK